MTARSRIASEAISKNFRFVSRRLFLVFFLRRVFFPDFRKYKSFTKVSLDALAKTYRMAMQKFRPPRLGVFSGVKAYIEYVGVLKKRHNTVGWIFLRRHHPLSISAKYTIGL
jgi:hypothetical protein